VNRSWEIVSHVLVWRQLRETHLDRRLGHLKLSGASTDAWLIRHDNVLSSEFGSTVDLRAKIRDSHLRGSRAGTLDLLNYHFVLGWANWQWLLTSHC